MELVVSDSRSRVNRRLTRTKVHSKGEFTRALISVKLIEEPKKTRIVDSGCTSKMSKIGMGSTFRRRKAHGRHGLADGSGQEHGDKGCWRKVVGSFSERIEAICSLY